MKRFWAFVTATCCLLSCLALCTAASARGEDAPQLPEGVIALLDAAHPDMTVTAYDGWGSEASGQFAVALTDGQRNVLCVAERAEGDAAYALSVDNPHALREGITPDILMDTVDALFVSFKTQSTQGDGYTWRGDVDHYNFVKGGDGLWRFAGLEHYDAACSDASVFDAYEVSVSGGRLTYERITEDENGNVLDRQTYMPIPVSEAYAASLALGTFDISLLQATPAYGIPVTDGLCDGLLEQGDALLDVDLKPDALAMLVRGSDGALRLCVYDGTDLRRTHNLPQDARFDEFHAGPQELMLWYSREGRDELADIVRLPNGDWSLSQLWADEASLDIGVDWVADPGNSGGFSRNNGFVYGEHPWHDVFDIDFSALPRTFEEAVSRMNTKAYALVNNPNPEDRLHLREKPDKRAKSLGKFYNRTPVKVLDIEGDWAQVRIGNAQDGLTGYMMTRYLAFGGDADVVCAFPQKGLIAQDSGGVPLLRAPAGGAEQIAGRFSCGERDYIIGVVGEDYYVLLRSDGAVGYARQELFEDGNG